MALEKSILGRYPASPVCSNWSSELAGEPGLCRPVQEARGHPVSLWPDANKGMIHLDAATPILHVHITWKEAIMPLWFPWQFSVCLYHLPWLFRRTCAQPKSDRETVPLFSNGKFTEYAVSLMMDLHSAEAGLAGGEGETGHRQKHRRGWKTETRRRF